MSSVVIIGGGLTGLVAGARLAELGIQSLVLEREAEAGGACRSIVADGFTFDHTGHLLHVARAETEEYLRRLGVWQDLVVHGRRAAVVIGGRTTPYPVQINTFGLSRKVRRDCLLGFVYAWSGGELESPANFEEWVLDRFGNGLAQHFFFPYNRKLYRAEPKELTLDWVGRYVPRPELEDVVDGAFGLYDAAIGYNATFRYPRHGGIRALPDAVAQNVPELRLGSEVTSLHLRERWIEVAFGERIPWRRLISTIALPALVDLVVDDLPEEVVVARRALRWVRVVNVALGVRGAAPTDDHWLYFPDSDLPYYRVGFPSNHGDVAPRGCHTVSIEISLEPAGGDVEAEATAAEAVLENSGLLDRTAVMVRRITVIDPAYVVFDHPRRTAVATLRAHLRRCGVTIAGRWAEWKYSAMEDAILDGMRAAKRMASGERNGAT